MYGYEHRDTSGPMEIDNYDPMDKIASFAVSSPEEGPSRKRLHSEILTPSRTFASASSSRAPLQFSQDTTPFLFHSANIPKPPSPQPFSRKLYNPLEFDFGFAQTDHGSRIFGEDVEMRDSPAKPPPQPAHQSAEEPNDIRGGSNQKAEGSKKRTETDDTPRPIASGAVSRELRKRLKRKGSKRQVATAVDSEEEEGGEISRYGRSYGPSKSEHQHHYNFHAPTLRHSEIPALMIGYIQVFVNVAVVVFVLYLAVQFVLTVRQDVKDRMQEVSVEILQEIAECSKLYLTNRCDPALRVPAMEAPCKAWEACMSRDPTMVGRTNVMAETFAGVINSFVDPISWKTMGFTLTTLCFLIILTNSALWNLKSKATPTPPVPPPSLYPQHLIHQQPHFNPPYPQSGYGIGYQGVGAGMAPGDGQANQDEMKRLGYGKEGKWWKVW